MKSGQLQWAPRCVVSLQTSVEITTRVLILRKESPTNLKKAEPKIIVIFMLANVLGFLIHATVLKADYMPLAGYYRPVDQEKILFISLSYLSFAIGSVWVYAKGVENKTGWGREFGDGISISHSLAGSHDVNGEVGFA
jgi:hypothetical protein